VGCLRFYTFFLLFSIVIFPLLAEGPDQIRALLQAGATQDMPAPGAEKANRESLKAILRERKIPFEERSLFAEYGGFGSSLVVSLSVGQSAGAAASEANIFENSPPSLGPFIFVLAIPLAGTGSAADGELPLRFRAALEFIKKIQNPEFSPVLQGCMEFKIAFTGDEGSLLPPELRERPHAGFEDLCSILDDPENAFLMYLDIQDTESATGLLIQHGSEAGISSLGALKNIPGICADLNIPWSLKLPFNGLYKFGLARGGPLVLAYAHRQAIDAIHISERGEWVVAGKVDGITAGSSGITADALGEFVFRYTAALDFGIGRDRRYAIIPLPGKAASQALIFLSESMLVLAFLAAGAVFILAALFFFFHHRASRGKSRIFGPMQLSISPVKSKPPVLITIASVLILLPILVSAFFDIGFLPLFMGSFFFVLLGFILHRPLPLFVCTVLAYIFLAGVCGILFINRGTPPVKTEAKVLERNAVQAETGDESLLVNIQSRIQLERLIIDLTLRSVEDPIRFDVSLVSGARGIDGGGEPFLIYSAPMPYLIDEERSSANFFLGEAPPNPLSLELILSRNFSGFLRAEALYPDGEKFQRVFREIPVLNH
jgi:hypothetical protein